MLTDTVIEDPRWEDIEVSALVERASQATLAHLGLEGAFEIVVLAADDARVAGLNADFRGKPQPTNVLSWPAVDLAADTPGARPDAPDFADAGAATELGDIALAYETCLREATTQGKSLQAHVTHLTVHGVLHLLGFDHVNDADAHLMEGLEIEILGNLGLDDPYSDGNEAAASGVQG